MTVKGIACLLFVIGCLNAVQASKINLRLLGQTSLTGGTAGPPSTEQVSCNWMSLAHAAATHRDSDEDACNAEHLSAQNLLRMPERPYTIVQL